MKEEIQFVLSYSPEIIIFPSLGVIPYNNWTLNNLRVSDCANKFLLLSF